MPRRRAASSHSARRFPYAPSARSCVALVLTSSRPAPAAAGSNGTCVVSSDRQSSSSACPAWDSSEADWSMMPVGTPTNSFSAWQVSATSSPRGTLRPPSEVSASAVAHSSAADEDRPAPAGTSESMATHAPGTRWPAPSSAHATPAG